MIANLVLTTEENPGAGYIMPQPGNTVLQGQAFL